MTLNRLKLISSNESTRSRVQHKKPCSDCPWRRDALPGWLGGFTPESWVATAHSDSLVKCHTIRGPQCAGTAIYRANVCKVPRDDKALRLPANRDQVFGTPIEFLTHHK